MSLSFRVTMPNGNLVRNDASWKRGSPYVEPPEPFPDPGEPNFFQAGTGPYSTLAIFFFGPLTQMAANRHGSLNASGRCRSEKWESAPVPSRQIIPAPIPPSGKAIRLSRSPEYAPLYFFEAPDFRVA